MRDYIKKQKRKIFLLKLVLFIVLFMVLITLSYSWLININQLNTLSVIQIPSKISITGANRSEMTRINLELTPNDTQNGDEVIIRRVFCVESTDDYWIELIRTTNIKDMDIKIYPVTVENSSTENGDVGGNDGTNTFYYTPDSNWLNGEFLNQDKDTVNLANDELHGENYVESDEVQKNAEPLYWRTKSSNSDTKEQFDLVDYSQQGKTADGTDIYYRYFVLQLTWKTSDQETDMIYLLASH